MASDHKSKLEAIKSAITSVPDFPKPGILFRDIFGILRYPDTTQYLFDELEQKVRDCIINKGKKIDVIMGIEARGFLLGPALALKLKCGFIPARKSGKLPGPCYSVQYDLEYGKSTLEIQKSSLTDNLNILILDDVLATGGTVQACIELINLSKCNCVGALVIIELKDLNARSRLSKFQISTENIFEF